MRFGVVKDILFASCLLHLPFVQNNDLFGKNEGLLHIVSHKERGMQSSFRILKGRVSVWFERVDRGMRRARPRIAIQDRWPGPWPEPLSVSDLLKSDGDSVFPTPQSHPLHYMVNPFGSLLRKPMRNAIGDIFKDRHMREKGRFLKDVANAPSMNRQVYSLFLIEIGHSADPNHPRIGFHPPAII